MPKCPANLGENSLGPQDSPVLHENERQSITGYAVSLPDHLVRTTAAGGGGLLLEAADHILPPPVRSARIYQCLITRPLRITVEAIGGVSGRFPEDSASGLELIKRKVAGNVMEAAASLPWAFRPSGSSLLPQTSPAALGSTWTLLSKNSNGLACCPGIPIFPRSMTSSPSWTGL